MVQNNIYLARAVFLSNLPPPMFSALIHFVKLALRPLTYCNGLTAPLVATECPGSQRHYSAAVQYSASVHAYASAQCSGSLERWLPVVNFLIIGSCHSGSIQVTIDGDLEESYISKAAVNTLKIRPRYSRDKSRIEIVRKARLILESVDGFFQSKPISVRYISVLNPVSFEGLQAFATEVLRGMGYST